MAERNFEDAMQRLEEITQGLEKGDLSLEDSIEIFEEGMQLAKFCTRKLEEAEKKVTKLIKEGKPLPEKYRFILFEDKREVELVWNGKSREVSTAVLPFQSLEHDEWFAQ